MVHVEACNEGKELALLSKDEEKSMVIYEGSTCEDYEGSSKANYVGKDMSSHFDTNEVFLSRDSAIKWCQDEGRKFNMFLVVQRSTLGNIRVKPRFSMGCERGGYYKQYKHKKPKCDKLSRSTGTKKCGCPFLIKSMSLSEGKWKLNVVCGWHNHKVDNILTGHTYVGRLNAAEVNVVDSLTDMGVCPKMVLTTLKKTNLSNVSTRKTVYNARAKYRKNKQQGLSCMQHTFEMLKNSKYVYFVKHDEKRKVVTHIFLSHPGSLQMVKCFPYVLVVDCTYKTNKYKLPLCEFVGVASTGLNLNVGFLFMENEKESSYVWALDMLKAVIDQYKFPSVFITDKEVALINAIKEVFPNAQRMLCKWHVSKNIVTNCKKEFETDKEWQPFLDSWEALIGVEKINQFEEKFMEFQQEWKAYPKVVSYVRTNWVPFKQYFVNAWTNQVMHLGNRTTQRAEGTHSTLKNYVKAASGSFPLVLQALDDMIKNQITELDASFQLSKIRPKHEHVADPTFTYLIGQISYHGIMLIFEEKNRALEFMDLTIDICGCVLRTSYGLPCAHEIMSYVRYMKPIPLSCIHRHWKQLSREMPTEDETGLDLEIDIFIPIRGMWDGTEEHKRALKRKILEIVEPNTSVLAKPDEKRKLKGRPKKNARSTNENSKSSTKRDPSGFEYAQTMEEKLSQSSVTTKRKPIVKGKKHEIGTGAIYMNNIPLLVQPLIYKLTNVLGDGHCGFNVLALRLGMVGSDAHFDVRRDLIKELEEKRLFYERLWGVMDVSNLKFLLGCFSSVVTKQHWMDTLYCGVLAANYYNRYIYSITEKGSNSFLPMFTPVDKGFKKNGLGWALINDHFIYVELKSGSPLPPIEPFWNRNSTPKSKGWMKPLELQMLAWKTSILQINEPIYHGDVE